jgi:DNA-binding transcriptional regulator YiaG
MATFGKIINDEIARLARRALREDINQLRSHSAAHRKHIATLRKEIVELKRELSLLRGQSKRAPAAAEASAVKRRFRVDGFKAWRQRVGLSAEDVGTLLGKTGQTILNWEHGTSKPTPALVDAIARVRSTGTRALKAELDAKQSPGRKAAKR